MSESVDQEIQAIKAVLAALSALSEKARVSVLEYVVKRLDVTLTREPQSSPHRIGSTPRASVTPASELPTAAPHIKQFKEEKRPRSANEMAALVGYYLANVLPVGQRKNTINQKDIETYFKIAGFPLPQQVRVTLPNAKAAGYFDLAGDGEYKLNAVGHNLVAHSMPRGRSSESKGAARRRKAPRSKVATRQGRRSAK